MALHSPSHHHGDITGSVDRVRGLGVSMQLWQHRELGEGPTDMPTPCSN